MTGGCSHNSSYHMLQLELYNFTTLVGHCYNYNCTIIVNINVKTIIIQLLQF